MLFGYSNMDDYVTNEAFIAHTQADAEEAKRNALRDTELHKRLDKIVAKQEEFSKKQDSFFKFMKNVDLGVKFFKFTYGNAGQIGAFLAFVFGIGLFIKYGLVGIFMWFNPFK